MNRNIWLLTTSESLSNLGDWLTLVALTILTYKHNSLPEEVAGVLALRCLPHIFFGSLGGVLADRFNKKIILLVCEFLRGLLILSLFFISKFYCYFIISFLVSLLGTFSHASLMALIPLLVPTSMITKLNNLLMMGRMLSMMIGPLLATWVIKIKGESTAFLIDAISFFVFCFLVKCLREENGKDANNLINENRQSERELSTNSNVSQVLGMKDDFSKRYANGLIWRSLFLNLIFYFSFGIWTTLMPVVSSEVLHLKTESLGLLMFIGSLGALVGGSINFFLINYLSDSKNLINWQFMSAIFAITALILIECIKLPLPVYFLVFILGISEAAQIVSARSFLHQNILRLKLGKMMATRKILESLGLAVGMIFCGLVVKNSAQIKNVLLVQIVIWLVLIYKFFNFRSNRQREIYE